MCYDALPAPRLPRRATPPTMEDQEVGERSPSLPGEDLNEVPLYLLRRGLFGEPHATRKALHMGVHHHPFIDSEGIAQHDIGRLPTDPGKAGEFGEALG